MRWRDVIEISGQLNLIKRHDPCSVEHSIMVQPEGGFHNHINCIMSPAACSMDCMDCMDMRCISRSGRCTATV